MAWLRGRGCRCPLIAKAGMGVPFTGCNESGDRAVCAKRMIAKDITQSPHEAGT